MSYEQLLENWRKRINRPLYDWRIYLNADGVLVKDGLSVHSLKNYKLPDLQFYKKSDLSGEPFARINESGLYIKNELVCRKIKHEKSIEIDFAVYEKYTYDKFVSLEKKYNRDMPCKDLPFYDEGGKERPIRLILNLRSLMGKIGKVSIKGHILYVDVSPFLKQPIKKTVKVMLIEKYGIEEFNKIEKDFNTIRVSYQKEDIKTLNNLFYDHCLKRYRKWEEENRVRKCKRKVLKRDFDFYKKIKLINKTIYELYRADIDELKRDSFHFDSIFDVRSLFIYKRGDNWILDAITRD